MNMKQRSTDPVLVAVALVSVLAAVILGAANIYLGDLNQDEGWYLYAARMVSQGQVLYRDFAFTQAPVLPHVYALFYPAVKAGGVLGGRVITWIFGIVASILAGLLARRLVKGQMRPYAFWITFIIGSLNAYHSYYTSVVKTYALCALFITAGVYLLSLGRRHWLYAVCSGVLVALAAGTRISAGLLLPILALGCLLLRRQMGGWTWFFFSLGGGVMCLIQYIPLFVMAPESFLFCNIEYHSSRSAGSLMNALVYKAGFISRLVQAYFILFALLSALVVSLFIPAVKKVQPLRGFPGLVLLGWVGVLAVTLLHFTAPFPYEDYQVMLIPLFSVCLTVTALHLMEHIPNAVRQKCIPGLTCLLLVLSLLSSFSSPVNQAWMIRGRDRIWWLMKEQPDIQHLRETARRLLEKAPDCTMLLTQDTYLAVEMDVDVPPGLEMGPFSYYPEWDREKCEMLHVLNREMLKETILTSDACLAAVSGYSLSIQSPEVVELPEEEQRELRCLLLSRYQPAGQVDHFGQAHTLLNMYVSKKEGRE